MMHGQKNIKHQCTPATLWVVSPVKVKLPLNTTWRHIRGLKVSLQSFLTSAIDGN